MWYCWQHGWLSVAFAFGADMIYIYATFQPRYTSKSFWKEKIFFFIIARSNSQPHQIPCHPNGPFKIPLSRLSTIRDDYILFKWSFIVSGDLKKNRRKNGSWCCNSPLPAVVYFFKLVLALAKNFGPFWPLFAILSRIYALFGSPFTGLNCVVVPSKLTKIGCGFYRHGLPGIL